MAKEWCNLLLSNIKDITCILIRIVIFTIRLSLWTIAPSRHFYSHGPPAGRMWADIFLFHLSDLFFPAFFLPETPAAISFISLSSLGFLSIPSECLVGYASSHFKFRCTRMSLCEFFFSVLRQIFPSLWSHIWESINFSQNSFWAACFSSVLNRLSLIVHRFNFFLNLALRPCSWFISDWKNCSRTSFFVQRGPPLFFANSRFSYCSPISDALLLSTQAGFLAPQLRVIV